MIGTTLAHYRITGKLGADGQAFVFTRIPKPSRSGAIRVFLVWFTELERLAGEVP